MKYEEIKIFQKYDNQRKQKGNGSEKKNKSMISPYEDHSGQMASPLYTIFSYLFSVRGETI